MFFQFSVLNGITCIVHVCERAYVYEWGFRLKWGLPAGIRDGVTHTSAFNNDQLIH